MMNATTRQTGGVVQRHHDPAGKRQTHHDAGRQYTTWVAVLCAIMGDLVGWLVGCLLKFDQLHTDPGTCVLCFRRPAPQ